MTPAEVQAVMPLATARPVSPAAQRAGVVLTIDTPKTSDGRAWHSARLFFRDNGRLNYVELQMEETASLQQVRRLLDELTARYGNAVEIKGSLEGNSDEHRSFKARFVDRLTGDRVALIVLRFPDGLIVGLAYAPPSTSGALTPGDPPS